MKPVIYGLLWRRPPAAEGLRALAALLPPARRARLPADRRRWDQPLAAWGLLALACREVWGLTALPPVEWEPGGRPRFSAAEDRWFSLSHTRGAAVCALWDRPVGVDVEAARKVSARLMDRLGAAGEEDFLRRWTCREAAAKRLGLGGAAPLLRPVEGEELCAAIPLGEGLAAALAAEGEPVLRLLSWEELTSRLTGGKAQ